MKNLHSINKDQGLYVFSSGAGYSCLGFEVVLGRVQRLSEELGVKVPKLRKGSKNALKVYYKLTGIVEKRYRQSGLRSTTELTPEFIGNEGRRVEVTRNDGTKERFIIGKSTGFIPCHLEIKRKDSTGGMSVMSFKSFRFVD